MSPKLTPQTPQAAYRINSEDLREQLTQVYNDSNGDMSDLRRCCVGVLKETLNLCRQSLFARIDQNKGGLSTARAFSAYTDTVITALWDFTLTHVYRARNPTQGERLSLVCVGGYGRGELAPHSDIDLLFLRAWKETPHSESVIEFILYSLWDLGFKVGHSSRTVDETIKYCKSDHTILTSVLESRLLTGDVELYQGLKSRLKVEVYKPHLHEFITSKLEERDARHNKSGDVRFVVEPNIKEGKGGLRDLQSLIWIARILSEATPHASDQNKTLTDWGALDALLSETDRQTFQRAFDFLWKIRILIHTTTRRAEERLGFDLQPEIALRMGFIDRHGEPAVERFMRRYFVAAKEVGALTRIFCTKLETQQTNPLTRLSHIIQSGIMSLTKPDHSSFVVNEGRLSVSNADVFLSEPIAVLSLFKMADRLGFDIHPDAFNAIKRSLSAITPNVRRDARAASLFLDILVRGKNPYRTLSLMVETGFLGRYIPEFGRIVAQSQFNMYHAYTVDEHTLRAIGIIHAIDSGQHKLEHPMATALMPQLAEKETLYLAMLMHDTGKGGEEGQEIGGEKAARKACARLGLKDWQIDQVAWLVRHHLVLSDYAQKRDVSDPQTIAAFARIVETPDRLRLLLILTVADIRAVGPGVWNGWKGQLMRDLLAATESFFRGGRGADAEAKMHDELKQRADTKRQSLSQKQAALTDWLNTMEDSYIVSFTPEELSQHADIALKAKDEGAFACAYIVPSRNATAFCIATKDRKGLFSDLARCMADLGANVVGAAVFTSKDGLALDIFYAQDALGIAYGIDNAVSLKQAQQILEASALKGTKPKGNTPPRLPARLSAFAIAPTVTFDDEANAHMSIIEVSGRDRTGLLADLAHILSLRDINIASAHIDCYGERAVDAFYVTSNNLPLTLDLKQRIKNDILDVFDSKQLQVSKRLAKGVTRARASLAR